MFVNRRRAYAPTTFNMDKTNQTVESKATNSSDESHSPNTTSSGKVYTIKDHWKCLAACTLVSMCPFQYGKPSQRDLTPSVLQPNEALTWTIRTGFRPHRRSAGHDWLPQGTFTGQSFPFTHALHLHRSPMPGNDIHPLTSTRSSDTKRQRPHWDGTSLPSANSSSRL